MMYTKQEVIDILNRMRSKTETCVGFIAGMVTKGWVHQMIDETTQEVINKPEPPEK